MSSAAGHPVHPCRMLPWKSSPCVSLLVRLSLVGLLTSACREKETIPAPDLGGRNGPKPTGAPTGTRATLNRYVLSDDELMMFLPRSLVLAKAPPPGVSSIPGVDEKKGRLRYGSIPVAGGAQDEAATLAFAVLLTPPAASAASAAEGTEPDVPAARWKLYIDRDRDGELADETALEMPPQKLEKKIAGRQIADLAARFPAVEVVLPGGVIRMFSVMAMVSGEIETAHVRSRLGLVARLEIFGKETDVRVYDANMNGRFGDVMRDLYAPSDSVWIDFDGNGRRDGGEVRPLARRIFVDAGARDQPDEPEGRRPRRGRALELTVSDDARRLDVKQVEVALGGISGAGVGPARAPEGTLTLQLFSAEYGLLGPLQADRVPASEHRLIAYGIARADEEGKKWVLAGGWLPTLAPRVTVPASGPPAEVRFGPPLEARPWLAFVGGKMLVRVALRGSGGEDVRVGSKGKRAAFKGYRVLSADGAKIASGELEAYRMLPGLYFAVWEPGADLEKGTKLTLDLLPAFGPFAAGFKARTVFELGRSTPVRLVVSSVDRGSQAGRAGVRPGDVIVGYDGRRIENEFQMNRALKDAAGKTRVEFVVLRKGVEEKFTLRPGRIGVQVVLAMPKGEGG